MAKTKTTASSKKRKRLRVRKVNALNIVINPHPDGRYVELFQAAMRKKIVFPFFGQRTGFVSTFRKDGTFYRGTLALFTDIDLARKWLDFQTGEEASEDDLKKIAIPQNLRPEYQPISFIFDAKKHRMLFVSNGLGIASAKKLIAGLLGDADLLNEGDQLEVTVVQDEDNLEQMLSERNILELTIELNLPNADDLADTEKELYERLRKMKSSRLVETITADNGKSLEPDREAKQLSHVALSNGKVTTKVRTDKGTIPRSTTEFPKTRRLAYDPESTTEFDALISFYREF